MIVEMENHKFKVKRVTHPKSHGNNNTLLFCYPISFLEQCYFSCLMPFLASNINKENYSWFLVTEILNKTKKLISESQSYLFILGFE